MKHWRGAVVGLLALLLVYGSLAYSFEGRSFWVGLLVLPFALTGCFVAWGLVVWVLYPQFRGVKTP